MEPRGDDARRRAGIARLPRRLNEAADGWRRLSARQTPGEDFVASLVDFGRPPVLGLVEPDFPMAQQLVTDPVQQRVVISCLVSDLRFAWILEPAGTATRISVHVDIPEREAFRLDNQQALISESLVKLAALAAAEA